MSILNQAEVAEVLALGVKLEDGIRTVAGVVAESATLIEAALTRSGHKSVKADKSVKITKKRKESITKFKDEFSAGLASASSVWRAEIAGALKKESMDVVTGPQWRAFLKTQNKSCPQGELRTLYNCVATAFKEAGYPVVASAAKPEEEEGEGEEGEEGEESSPGAGEITLMDLVKFFADRNVSVELAAGALTCLAQSAGVAIPAAVLAHVAEEDVLEAAASIIDRQDAALKTVS